MLTNTRWISQGDQALSCAVGTRTYTHPPCSAESSFYYFILFYFIYFILLLFTATPMAHDGSQARSLIKAIAACLHHSHSNAGSEPRLQPPPQLTAMLYPQPSKQGQGSNPRPLGC